MRRGDPLDPRGSAPAAEITAGLLACTGRNGRGLDGIRQATYNGTCTNRLVPRRVLAKRALAAGNSARRIRTTNRIQRAPHVEESASDRALGRVPSGIFILTTCRGEQTTGMLASWVMQAGFDPPTVSVAVKLGRYVCDWLSAGAPFVLNLVGDGQTHFLKHFGSGFAAEEPAFEGVEITRSDRGVPILSASAGYLECQPTQHVDSGDHRIFLATISGGDLLVDVPPMVHVRKSGAHY